MADFHQLENIVEKCKKGDSEAFNQLIDLYSNRCYGYFFRITGRADVSDELLSDLFIRLTRKIRAYKGGSFDKWIFTVCSNLFKDHLRRRQREKKLLSEKANSLKEEQLNAVRSPEIFDKLEDAIAKLDPETAELITLRYYSQISFKELAELRNEPIGTTLSKVHRGVKRLRTLIDEL